MNNYDKVNGIVSGILGVVEQDIHADFKAADADAWDSLNHINLVTAIEEEFGVQFSTEVMDQIKSVEAIRNELRKLGIVFDD